ncbi:MAG: T9SS type A sorting domain-containing protein, partial [Ignavibacteria bacterium]|nr:T9SS type A sorting domain-containing protein [Ignavibacteria bacterium]
IDLTSDNKIIIAGFTSSFGFGGYDAFLMKLNLDGTLVWFHTYGGYTNDYGNSVKETPDLGYALTGRRSTNTIGSDDVYLLKTDQDGHSPCDFGIFSPNVFAISNLQAIDLNLYTSNVVSISDLPLTVFTPNTAENISCSIIPVELKSFNYQLEKNDVVLNWSTATETNNMGFKILRDNNEVGFIPGTGTTTEPRKYIFTDENVPSGIFLYSLLQIDYDGTNEIIGEIEVVVNNTPSVFSLLQNYPNPFNPLTIIRFTIPERTKVVLKVYDVLGTEVSELINDIKSPGRYEVKFDSKDLPSGTYFYTIQAGNFISFKKMILLK